MKIFNKPEVLEEKPSDLDNLEFSKEISRVNARIKRLVEKKRHSIIAYLGPFGIGKSTVLNGVQKESNDYIWVTFEMWRYANRNELWDGFVIKLVSELSSDKKEYDVANDIEGTSLLPDEYLSLAAWIGVLTLGSVFLGFVFWSSFHSDSSVFGLFLKAYFKYALPLVFTILVGIGLLKFLQLKFISDKRPLRRIFELENVLSSSLKELKKPLIVIVEDVDRTSLDGPVFLETLNSFLNYKLPKDSKPIVVIAPQSTNSFDRYEGAQNEGLERSLKIYDEKMYFNSPITDRGLAKFYESLEVKPEFKTQIIDSTKIVVDAYRSLISIRLLKHALREVNQFAEMNSKIDPSVSLAIVLSKYVSVTTAADIKHIAQTMIVGGQEFDSERLRPFFLAMSVGLGSHDMANRANRYTLKFSDSNTLATAAEFVHPNGVKRYDITLPSIYERLVI